MHLFQRPSAIIILLLFAFSIDCPAEAVFAPITVKLDHNDGGKESKRHLRKLLAALSSAGCGVEPDDDNAPPQLLFDSRPVPIARRQLPGYRLIAVAKTLDGRQSVRGAVLVHASTGIDKLSSLQGERIAFVGKDSWSGYHLALQSLRDAGVEEQPNTFFFVGNHVGTISMLLHSDVFAAVSAEPLASRWAESNGLKIVALTNAVETGGWWALKGLSPGQVKLCSMALSSLQRDHLKALPAWVGGFEPVTKAE